MVIPVTRLHFIINNEKKLRKFHQLRYILGGINDE